MAAATFDKQLAKHVAQLANIPVSDSQASQIATDFSQTLQVIDNLTELEIAGVEPTHQVTGLENVWREDQVDTNRSFSQAQALKNAHRSYHGYFMVDQIIDQDE